MNFSQRQGHKPIRSIIQVDSIDQELRNAIWNNMHSVFFGKLPTLWDNCHYEPFSIVTEVWTKYFHKAIDDLPQYPSEFTETCKKNVYKGQWNEVYDFIEFFCQLGREAKLISSLDELINTDLKKFLAGYRILDHMITPIIDKEEIDAIEKAVQPATVPVGHHIWRALELLSDRNKPDYRNSIKESISAVEAMCKAISGNNKATLNQALTAIEKRKKLHPSLKIAFDKLYAYTSDSDGIRHSLMEESTLTLDDAKFMLVSCSAFINYLKSLQENNS